MRLYRAVIRILSGRKKQSIRAHGNRAHRTPYSAGHHRALNRRDVGDETSRPRDEEISKESHAECSKTAYRNSSIPEYRQVTTNSQIKTAPQVHTSLSKRASTEHPHLASYGGAVIIYRAMHGGYKEINTGRTMITVLSRR